MARIVVVGGGWARCAAALAANKAGAEIILLERTDCLLGTGLVGGIMRKNGRFTAASLGSTVFGAILDGAGGDHSGYRLCYGVLIAVALAAVMLALSVLAARETAPRLAGGV